jgi:hypothetical protein
VLKIAPETAMRLTFNDVIKRLVVSDPEEITPLQRMFSGGIAGAVAQVRGILGGAACGGVRWGRAGQCRKSRAAGRAGLGGPQASEHDGDGLRGPEHWLEKCGHGHCRSLLRPRDVLEEQLEVGVEGGRAVVAGAMLRTVSCRRGTAVFDWAGVCPLAVSGVLCIPANPNPPCPSACGSPGRS